MTANNLVYNIFLRQWVVTRKRQVKIRSLPVRISNIIWFCNSVKFLPDSKPFVRHPTISLILRAGRSIKFMSHHVVNAALKPAMYLASASRSMWLRFGLTYRPNAQSIYVYCHVSCVTNTACDASPACPKCPSTVGCPISWLRAATLFRISPLMHFRQAAIVFHFRRSASTSDAFMNRTYARWRSCWR